jgi:hypothetical protein
MRKWWWWVPGFRKKWKLEKHRVETLSDIIGERVNVEAMAQRPGQPTIFSTLRFWERC